MNYDLKFSSSVKFDMVDKRVLFQKRASNFLQDEEVCNLRNLT
jgi:hypothetical protein